MLSKDRTRLEIFRKGISVNQTLSKSTNGHDKDATYIKGGMQFVTSDGIGNLGFVSGGGGLFRNRVHYDASDKLWDGLPFPVKTSFVNRFHMNMYTKYLKVRRTFSKKKLPPSKFFEALKQNTSEFSNIDEHITELTKQRETLYKAGQADLYNKFGERLMILEAEKKLRDNNFDQFLTEDNLVKFVLKSVRGLRRDYILEFDRIIPDDVIESKDKAEELCVFDNYVILHYDPEAAELLKSEVQAKEEKKDPILFGLIKGSTKLYFIDDWIDEKCDLTYSKIIEALDTDEKIV